MSDTLPNIELPGGQWVDLYAASGITVGTQIVVENLGSSPVDLITQATQPPSEPSGFQRLHQRTQKTSDDGEAGAWARSPIKSGLVNVKEL